MQDKGSIMKNELRKIVNIVFKNNVLYKKLHILFLYFKKKELNLHLCCGRLYEKGWVNIDANPSVKTDLIMDMIDVKKYFSNHSIKNIKIIHGLSYLRFHEALDFLKDCYNLLENDGRLIIEIPDIKKLSKNILGVDSLCDEKGYFSYIEALRAIYAFDLGEHQNKVNYITYKFGWSAEHLKYELEKLGYKNIQIENPEYHCQLCNRDFRLIASK